MRGARLGRKSPEGARTSRRPRDGRRWAAHALLAALLFRAVLPVGYMPNFEAGHAGAPLLILCPSVAGETYFSHHPHGEADGQPGGHIYACHLATLTALAASLWPHALPFLSGGTIADWSLPADEVAGYDWPYDGSARSPPQISQS